MFHPFKEDLSSIKEEDLESKIHDLTKKYHQAYRLGKPELLTQLSTFITIYREELSKRYYERSKKDLGGDLDQLINVD
jgi:hypothetical protein